MDDLQGLAVFDCAGTCHAPQNTRGKPTLH
jgi:hypothetical protein